MELNGYRSFKNKYVDNGQELLSILEESFTPDFLNRNTIQIWDVSAASYPKILKWIGATLTNRTVHEITIVNNSGVSKNINFDNNYHLVDEDFIDNTDITIGAYGSAYFYCTAVLENNNLVLSLRTGSQDDRKL